MNLLKLIKLSVRNVFRNRRRTLITLCVAASGFAALSIVSGFVSFTLYGLQELTIRNSFTGSGGTGHIQVVNKDSLLEEESYPMQFGIDNYNTVEKVIQDVDDVSFAMPRIEFSGLISTGEKSVSFLGIGIDPGKEAELLAPLADSRQMQFDNTTLYDLQKTPNGVLLGKGLARSMKADVGTTLMLISTTTDGAVNAVDVTVAGVISTGLKTADRYYLLTHVSTVQSLMQTDRVSRIVVVLNSTESAPVAKWQVKEAIEKNIPSQAFAVTKWDEIAEYYHSVRDIYNIIFSFMGIIVVVIVILSCTNTMLMATMERIREIGTLKAMGISGRWVNFIFSLEGFFIGVGSVVIGFILSYILSSIINASTIAMPPPPGMSSSYVLEVYTTTGLIPWIALLIILSTTLSSMLTLWRVGKISIVEALNHV